MAYYNVKRRTKLFAGLLPPHPGSLPSMRKRGLETCLELKPDTDGWPNLKHPVSVSSLCGSLSVIDIEGANSNQAGIGDPIALGKVE